MENNKYEINGIEQELLKINKTLGEGFMDVIKTASNEYIDNQRESAAKTIACHAAIRAGKKLSNTEMEELIIYIGGLEVEDNPNTDYNETYYENSLIAGSKAIETGHEHWEY